MHNPYPKFGVGDRVQVRALSPYASSTSLRYNGQLGTVTENVPGQVLQYQVLLDSNKKLYWWPPTELELAPPTDEEVAAAIESIRRVSTDARLISRNEAHGG